MVKIIMHGCNGHMGQVISSLVEKDPNAQIVAGIDIADNGNNSYPVFTDMEACDTPADVLIDFSSPKAADQLMDYCVRRSLPQYFAPQVLVKHSLQRWKKHRAGSRFFVLPTCLLGSIPC